MDPEPSSPLSTTSTSTSSYTTAGLSPPGIPPNFLEMPTPKPSIRVYLLRQICVHVHGQKAWRNSVLGEGTIWPVESPTRARESEFGGPTDGDEAVDWEGEVRCNGDVRVGGFHAGTLIVKVCASDDMCC